MKNRSYNLIVVLGTMLILTIIAVLTIVIDPYFHYHKPLADFYYGLGNERYQNDGVLRHFDYDALITGTSMTENFKTSECDNLFNVKSVLTPFSGGSYKEINDNINRAVVYNKNIKMIIRGIDISYYFSKADEMRYDESFYPTYLTNDNLFDDVSYLLNKSVLFNYTIDIARSYSKGNGSVKPFDIAFNWNDKFEFGKEAVLSSYNRLDEKVVSSVIPSADQLRNFQKNIDVNIVSAVKAHPEIQFYYFITPYSIVYWDGIERNGKLEMILQAEKMIIESLIEYDNVHLFSFSDDLSITGNLDNYKDIAHYSEDINSYMLQSMSKNKHRLTKDNYQEYLKKMYHIYSTYDYDSLF